MMIEMNAEVANASFSVRASETTAQAEERFKLLVENIKDYAISMLGPSGIIHTWNMGAQVLKGYAPSEALGQNVSIFYTSEDLLRNHPQEVLNLASRFGRYEEEGWRVRKDGSRFWANVVISRIDNAAGEIVGFAKITRDLSERRKILETLRQSEERFRLLVDEIRDYGIYMLDENGYIQTWNKGASRLNGYDISEILGKHFSIFYDTADVASGKCLHHLKVAAEKHRYEEEGWRLRKDKSRFWASVVITALYDEQGQLRGFSKVVRDISDRKVAEDELRTSRELLERRVEERTHELSKAVEARDEFLSIASHELKTPVTSLRLQNQIFERQVKRGDISYVDIDRLQRMVELSSRQLGQLTRLIEDMIDVSRIRNGNLYFNFEVCNLSTLTETTIQSFSPNFAAENIAFDFNIEPGIFVRGDTYRLEQVILNLLSNALKYGAKKPVRVVLAKAGMSAVLSVSDHGIGIDPQYIHKIFNRFERAIGSTNISGLGLGLYIGKEIVTAHGGSIAVESSSGQGSTFSVILPLDTKTAS